MGNAERDANRVPVAQGVDDTTGLPSSFQLDSNGRLKLSAILASGSGDVVGPASATNNAIVRYDTTTGKLIQDSAVLIADTTGVISGTEGVTFNGTTSGTTAIVATAISGTSVLTLPVATDTLVGKATTDILTNKSIDLTNNTLTATSLQLKTAVSDETGSGSLVFGTSPTLVTPALGTPASGVATNLTGTASGLTAGNVTTNANLTGDVTSVGNATTIAAKAVDVAMLADGTDGELVTWNTSGVATTVPAGTAAQVLTSNGAGAEPTFQAAAGGGTPRRTFTPTMNILNIQTGGTVAITNQKTASGGGIQAAVTGNADSSLFSCAVGDAGSFATFDNDFEVEGVSIYTAGSTTGDGIWFLGDTGGTSAPTVTKTGKCIMFMADTVSGSLTYYAVNANGTTNTNASLSTVTAGLNNSFRFIKDSTTDIKFYVNDVLKSTSTTNLPSGDGSSSVVMGGVKNDTGDTTTRTAQFGLVNWIINKT